MIGIDNKEYNVELKDDGYGDGTLSGYFAVFGNVDRSGEIINPGAFLNLNDFVRDGAVYTDHDRKKLPVAYPTEAVQDSRGLRVTAKWHSTSEAQAVRTVARERMLAGKSCQASIGYKIASSHPDRVNGKSVMRLTGVNLYEVSLVSIAANPLAGLVSAKRDPAPLLSVKDISNWIETEVKAGRTVSADNLAKIRSMRDDMQSGVDQLTAFVDVHDPNSGQSNPFQSIDDSVASSGGRTGGGAAVARAAKALRTWLDVATKYGRQLSAEHHRELSDTHRALHYAVENLGTFLAEHRPGAVDDVGASLDKSSNPFLEGFQRIDNRRARLLELRAKMEELSNRALIAVFAEEERAEAAASKAKSKR